MVDVDRHLAEAGKDAIDAANVIEVRVREEDRQWFEAVFGDKIEHLIGIEAAIDDPAIMAARIAAGHDMAVGLPIAQREYRDDRCICWHEVGT